MTQPGLGTAVSRFGRALAMAVLLSPHVAAAAADLGVSLTALIVVDPDGAGPLAPVGFPPVAAGVPPLAVVANGYVRFDAAFGNAGSSTASNVVLTVQLPDQGLFVGGIATGGVFVPAAQPPSTPFSFTIQTGGGHNVSCSTPDRSRLTCTPKNNAGDGLADGELPAGDSGTVTVFAQINASTAGGSGVSAAANITSAPGGAGATTDDPNPGNNTAVSAGRPVVAVSNFLVTSLIMPAVPPGTPLVAGQPVTYRVTVTNLGPSDVINLRIVDTLPANLRFTALSLVVPAASTLSCDKPSIDNDLFVVGLGGNLATAKPGGGQVVCTAPSLSATVPNNAVALDITAAVDPTTAVNVVNDIDVDATVNSFNRPTATGTSNNNPVTPAP